jgi:hypothetical protein
MRNQVIKEVERSILASHPEGASYSVEALTSSSMPEGVRHFLMSALERRAEMEASSLLASESEWFDYRNDEFQSVLHQAVLALRKTAHFPSSEWHRAVRQAVENVLNYLITPVPTLCEFAFSEHQDWIPTIDLQRKSKCFSDYPYVTRAVDAFISLKDDQKISRTEFENALSHLDVKMTLAHDASAWIGLLRPLIGLMSSLDLGESGLPVSFATEFFEGKMRPKIAASITAAATERGADMITVESLESIIKTSLDQTASEPASSPSLSDIANSIPSGESKNPDEAESENSTAEIPLWKKFQKKATENQPAEPSNTKTQPLWKTFKTDEERPSQKHKEPAPVVNAGDLDNDRIVLGSAVTRRERYVQELFGGNEEAFLAVMTHLAHAADWTSASSVIAEHVFRPYQVDIYSSIAVDFTNAVESRYSGTVT